MRHSLDMIGALSLSQDQRKQVTGEDVLDGVGLTPRRARMTTTLHSSTQHLLERAFVKKSTELLGRLPTLLAFNEPPWLYAPFGGGVCDVPIPRISCFAYR
jgi:hypothetical protein